MAEPDLIAAVATAPGIGAIGVVRLSGPDLHALAACRCWDASPSRGARCWPTSWTIWAEPIDEGLALYFPAPHSYTGEDVLELQGHGGPAVLQLLLKRCLELGARLARAGRVYPPGISQRKAGSGAGRGRCGPDRGALGGRGALGVALLQGEFSTEIHALVADVTSLRTLVEACIDFPEEGIEQLPPARRESTA